MVTKRDIQSATARVEARLGSPDGYQTFDTGTNHIAGSGVSSSTGEPDQGASGSVTIVFAQDGSCSTTFKSKE
jgi:hypothetical protein